MILSFFLLVWPVSMLALGVFSFFYLKNRWLGPLLPLSILGALTILMSRRWAVDVLETAGCIKGEGLAFDCATAASFGFYAMLAKGLLASTTFGLIYMYLLFPMLVALSFLIQRRSQEKA